MNKIINRINKINKTVDVPLVYKLIILLKSHKSPRYICTKTSVAFRVCILCDLTLKKVIFLDQILKVNKVPSNPIEAEMVKLISEIRDTPKIVLKSLNGEMNKKNSIKSLKSKIYKEMENKYIEMSKSSLYTKIKLTNKEIYKEVFTEIVSESKYDKLKTENKVILILLHYINECESLLVQCNLEEKESIYKNVLELIKSIKNRNKDKEDKLIYLFLKELF